MDSYGSPPPKYGDTYYLCPNTTYTITYNCSDYSCQPTNFDWEEGLPDGWTKYWEYNSTVSINTNEYPYGQYDIYAETGCSDEEQVLIFTQYFSNAECGEYFMVFPNPTENYLNIDVNKEKVNSNEISIDAEYSLTIIDKTGTIKYKNDLKGFPAKIETSFLKKGFYLINILYNGKTSIIKVLIEH